MYILYPPLYTQGPVSPSVAVSFVTGYGARVQGTGPRVPVCVNPGLGAAAGPLTVADLIDDPVVLLLHEQVDGGARVQELVLALRLLKGCG